MPYLQPQMVSPEAPPGRRGMYYAYILQSLKTNGYYFGSSSDVFARLDERNRGCCYTTSRTKPWKLAWYAAFETRRKAEEFERYLKTGSGYAFSRKRLL
jgi:predicted GIY-YIG superfamily endonuclease